jgi:undecaprenyl diphosphate synthase
MHIAFIMDGNGRWAQAKGLSRSKGHLAGINHIKKVVEICTKIGIPIVSAYVWSTENWARPNDEVENLMANIVKYGPDMVKELHTKGIKILHCGARDMIDKEVLDVIDFAINLTKNNGPNTLNLAFNYGARNELIDMAKRIVKSGISPEQIDEHTIQDNLYSPNLPDVDLLVRSGGDIRLSNFLLWQCSNSVMHFTNAYWPSLGEKEIADAIKDYNEKTDSFTSQATRTKAR